MAASGGALPEGLQGQCPYTLLGLFVSEDGKPASVQEAAADEESVERRETLSSKAIGTAYRKAALKAHPDKNKGREAAAAADFVKVNLAFAYLSDQSQRNAYHRHLRALLGLRLQREQQRQRWTERDKEKQRFKEDLQRREAEARKVSAKESEKEIIRRIREQNEELLRQKQEEINAARRCSFRDQLAQQQQREHFRVDSHSLEEVGQGESMEDILYRSLLLSWSPTVKSETGSLEGIKTSDPGDSKAGISVDAPNPSSLAAQLWRHGAIDLCFFSKAKGMACVSFTSRDRAIESALLLQQHRKSSKNTSSGKTYCPNAKLGNKAKGLAALLQTVRSAADASESPKEEEQVVSGSKTEPSNDKEQQNEARALAKETEAAAAAFAAALAAAQANPAKEEATLPATAPTGAGAASAMQHVIDTGSISRASSSDSRMTQAAEARATAAAFGLGHSQATKPVSCAASRILAYIKACNDRGQADAKERQAEIEHEKEWEWLGGSKMAANMSMEQLEAAAFGALEQKKQRQEHL